MACASSPEGGARAELRHQDSGSAISDELELLRNVYLEEMKILRSGSGELTELQFHLTPSTADDKEQQYVYLDLSLGLPPTYPLTPPTLTLLESRGLADAHLSSIKDGMEKQCSELLGSPMVYEVVEWVRESLTAHNRPCGQCALCLSDFMEEEGESEFVKTDCYHYFHTGCLLRYISHHQRVSAEEEEEGRRELECPVCRKTLPDDSLNLGGDGEREKEGDEETFEFVPSPSLRRWQRRMAALLRRQKERGGVIDLSRKDAVIDETWVRTPPSSDGGKNTTGKDRNRVSESPAPPHSGSSSRECDSGTLSSESRATRVCVKSSGESGETEGVGQVGVARRPNDRSRRGGSAAGDRMRRGRVEINHQGRGRGQGRGWRSERGGRGGRRKVGRGGEQCGDLGRESGRDGKCVLSG